MYLIFLPTTLLTYCFPKSCAWPLT